MTHENRQANIAAELQRGGEALRAAQLLVEHHMLPDSVSRAYYGMLYHARALLLTEGHEPKTHGGVTHLLNLHFVRAGIFSPEHARAFARLQSDREDADYDSAALFTAEQCRDILRLAGDFSEECCRLIGSRGCLP